MSQKTFNDRIMLYKTIILIGEIISIIAAIDVLQKKISVAGKVITIIFLLLLPWLGGAIYYLYAKEHLNEWFK